MGIGRISAWGDQSQALSTKVRSRTIDKKEIESIIRSQKPMEQCRYRYRMAQRGS